MERRQRAPGSAQGCGNLQQAARVCARVDVGLGREDVLRLAVAELARCLRLREVVDAGAAAADLLLSRLDKLEPGDRPEQRARLQRDALRVLQVARVLERDAQL